MRYRTDRTHALCPAPKGGGVSGCKADPKRETMNNEDADEGEDNSLASARTILSKHQPVTHP